MKSGSLTSKDGCINSLTLRDLEIYILLNSPPTTGARRLKDAPIDQVCANPVSCTNSHTCKNNHPNCF